MLPSAPEPRSAGRSRWRLSLRSVMIAIAFLALVMALVVQSVRLARLEARTQAALAAEMQARARAEAARQRALQAVDMYYTQVARDQGATTSPAPASMEDQAAGPLRLRDSAIPRRRATISPPPAP